MAISSSITNKIPLKPEFTFRVSISTRIRPFATCHASKKPLAPLRVYSTIAAPDEIPEKPVDPRWREIHGENDWAGLLDPMDPTLRTELLRNGDMAQACYEAFDAVDGGCKYAEEKLFTGVDLEDCGYDVIRYLYVKQGAGYLLEKLPVQGAWAGYIAVSDDERSARMGHRDITVVWNGAVSGLDWMCRGDFRMSRDWITRADPSVRICNEFQQLYTGRDCNGEYCRYSLREQVLEEITRLLKQHDNNSPLPLSITVTGHGLGSALALLCAYDMAVMGCSMIPSSDNDVPITVFSFSSPRVGSIRFKERLEEVLGVKVLRVHNVYDMVPRFPGIFINEQMRPWLAKVVPKGLVWSHVGREVVLDHTNSPFIKCRDDDSAHSLELLLHLVNGYHGSGVRFKPTSKRDIELLNKDYDLLNELFGIPAYWREGMNKAYVMKKKKNNH